MKQFPSYSKIADTPFTPLPTDDVMCKPTDLWDDMGMEFQDIPNTFVFAHPTPHSACFFTYADITSESVANGFVLQIVPSKRASGKTIRRLWVFVFSSRAMRLQRSTVLSDFCAFNRSTSSPSNPTHVRMTPPSSSRRKSTCTTRSFPRRGRNVKSQT